MKLIYLFIVVTLHVEAKEFPEYSEYKVEYHSQNKVNDIKIDTSDMHWKISESIGDVTGQPFNFAGKYYLFQFGCGTECIGFKMIDLDTGQVIDANIEPASWGGFCFQRDSGLLIANPYSESEYNEQKDKYQNIGIKLPQTKAYYWNGQEFSQLAKTYKVYYESCIRK